MIKSHYHLPIQISLLGLGQVGAKVITHLQQSEGDIPNLHTIELCQDKSLLQSTSAHTSLYLEPSLLENVNDCSNDKQTLLDSVHQKLSNVLDKGHVTLILVNAQDEYLSALANYAAQLSSSLGCLTLGICFKREGSSRILPQMQINALHSTFEVSFTGINEAVQGESIEEQCSHITGLIAMFETLSKKDIVTFNLPTLHMLLTRYKDRQFISCTITHHTRDEVELTQKLLAQDFTEIPLSSIDFLWVEIHSNDHLTLQKANDIVTYLVEKISPRPEVVFGIEHDHARFIDDQVSLSIFAILNPQSELIPHPSTSLAHSRRVKTIPYRARVRKHKV